MAFLPWQQVSAPNNSTAASFMKLAMQGVESAGKSFSDAAQGAADIQKNKADMAREKANALLTGQVLNAPDSEAASKLMQDALTASGDSGLFNTQSLQDAQDVRKTRIDTESAEVGLDFDRRTLEDRVTHERQTTITNSQNIEDNEHILADKATQDAVKAMASPIRNFYLDTESLPSTEELGSWLNEYFKANDIDPNSSRGQLIQTKFASQVQEQAMATALEIEGKLTPEKAATEAKDIVAGTPNLSSTATVDALNKTGSIDQVVKKAVTDMTALGGEKWDKNTTGASTPQEWESKFLMLAGKHEIPAGQLQMMLSMGFRDVDDENGFKDAAVAAQQRYVDNKRYEITQNKLDTQLTKLNQDIQRKELSLKMLMNQDGTLTSKQVADKKYEIDELKEAQKILEISIREAELGKWADPHKVKVAEDDLPKGGTIEVIKDFITTGPVLLGPFGTLYAAADKLNKAINGPEDVKGKEMLTDSEALGRWKEGDIPSEELKVFTAQLNSNSELKEEFANWYRNNMIQARDGDKKSRELMAAPEESVYKSFMQHHAIVSGIDDSIREAELAELNTDRIVNELTQKALANQGMTPVEPINLSGSGRANASNTNTRNTNSSTTNTDTSNKGPDKNGVYVSDWANINRNPDPAGSTKVMLYAGQGADSTIKTVADDFFQENFGRPLSAPEWQAVRYDLITSVGNNRTLDNTVSREVEIPNELLERLFSSQN